MAVVGGEGASGVAINRRFEDYKSLKQYLQNSSIGEVIITGTTETDGAAKEVSFVGDGLVIQYIAAEGQVYIRTELDDLANQDSKFVYLEYHDDTGAIKEILTADLDNADTTTEVIVTGATDFFRLRQMISEVEATATKGILLTDSAHGGADDNYGFINDGNSQFNLQRFFVQPLSNCISYLAHIECYAASTAADVTVDSWHLEVTFTPLPKVLGAGVSAPAAKTLHYDFAEHLVIEPCLALAPATEVIFKVGDSGDAGHIFLHAVMVEDYSLNQRRRP